MRVSLADLTATARVVSVPLRVRFRGVEHREALLFEGPNGWAEWSPFLEYPDDEAAVWLAAAIEFAFGAAPTLVRDRIEVNATLPAVSPSQVEQVLAGFGKFRTVKIKVAEPGQGLQADLDRIAKVVSIWPNAKLRLDANGGFNVATAQLLANACVENGWKLEYFEQPVASVDQVAELRGLLAALGVLIAADESVRKASDPLAVAKAQAADLLVVKAAPLGGVSRALEIVQEAGLPAVVSSALETSVGLSMGLHLAGALEGEARAAGLGTAALLAADVVEDSLVARDGFIEVKRVVPSQSLLSRHEAIPERRDWWLQRLGRCLELLPGLL
ncbi:MAG: o-succinylbenzoate synthase [Micrococcales bacterium]